MRFLIVFAFPNLHLTWDAFSSYQKFIGVAFFLPNL